MKHTFFREFKLWKVSLLITNILFFSRPSPSSIGSPLNAKLSNIRILLWHKSKLVNLAKSKINKDKGAKRLNKILMTQILPLKALAEIVEISLKANDNLSRLLRPIDIKEMNCL